MRIDEHMDLNELAEHMGEATIEQARRMRELLLEKPRARTEDFTGKEWAELVIEATR
ncbi:hypothetical protein GCM10008955_05820 [Deinococcus malanensis]|uniref:Uncharacterized protein n=1 Tax=Deinococcus malanensis TaxID=1706855 RepID=A0ABQ2ENE1_9DEIO|nr:hypothetical protein [Deinococcus malanensis]GGK15278.1 hypothetical protein GCM10008955_05820 [Deinococcus malanensis]